ncbi:FixH family protein [Aquibium oceanicum]|uniref:Cytochrome oxidase n=1 Tax=Aquibium oceanicum TaxID=1670800 RepID=A0A1L3SU40_9HYPH|nr:FixH family protein [Aquibium oceanicum]APH72904.1 hypothetical protein BSQ44_17170 [Aquibium oceanicum]
MNQRGKTSGEFTGRHMLIIMLAFFGVIIAVNLTMASFANSSWSGLVVKNSYVASQEFNEKAAAGRAQAALGWSATMAYADGEFAYSLADRDGKPVRIDGGVVQFRRPITDVDDHSVGLTKKGRGRASAAVSLGDGAWIVEVDADAGMETPFRDVRRVTIRGGVLQ